jgi:GDP-L-fucose synthase
MIDWKNKKILVTGGNGFLGHHVVDALKSKGAGKNITIISSKKYDLTSEENVKKVFIDHSPEIVFHLAGLVGGILPNKERPAEYFYKNLTMGTFMLHHSWANKVEKFIAAGAGCGYPEKAPIPLKESSFWDGFPQKESAPYSLAKRLLSVQSEAYNRQYGFTSIICIPGNIYGSWDNFNLKDAHVIPALVRKFVEAKLTNAPQVEVWGSGKPTRDFVYAGDVALGMIRASEVYNKNELVNMSTGQESSIITICTLLKELTSYEGEIIWNDTYPDGQLRRCFDMTKAKNDLQFVAPTDIKDGLKLTVDWYRENINNPEVRK